MDPNMSLTVNKKICFFVCSKIDTKPDGQTGLIGQEDCLVLNVHTSNSQKIKPLLPGVNFINVLLVHFFVQNFGAKNYKAVFWV